MATADTHNEIAAGLRTQASQLRDADGHVGNDAEPAHSLRIVGYEIAAALHGIAAALYTQIGS